MKVTTVASLILVLMGMTLSLARPSSDKSRFIYQSKVQLGVEITTNSCNQTLYFPVGMTKKDGLIATVPVQGGGTVSAVRISPVMDQGKVKFNVFLVSGNYAETISSEDLRRLLAVQVSTRIAAKGETLVVRDDVSDAPWSVNIKAVELRQDAVNADNNPEFLKAGTKQDTGLDKPCGCAWCRELYVCPTRGNCITTTCGTICCPNGWSEEY